MGFSLGLDNGNHVWLQCKCERVFRLCFSCGCIGHKADTCTQTPQQISQAMQSQLSRVREILGLKIVVDPAHVYYVNEARAFANHPSRKTTRIHLNFMNGHMEYFPFDVRC